MSKPQKAVVSKTRTVNTYSELWHASGCVLESGKTNATGSSWQFLSSAVLTAFSFEAYLNHIGPTLFPCWSQLERLPPWAKFELLCEHLRVTFPEGTGSRPLQTAVQLLDFRNSIAHGRTESLSPPAELRDANANLDSYLGDAPLTNWQRLIGTSDFALRAREDIKTILQTVHDARPGKKEHLFQLSHGTHSATLVPGY